MTPFKREVVVLLGLAAAFCISLLLEPEWYQAQAHLLCPGQPVKVFESITACSADMRPGCPCVRPENPWVYVYWLTLLPALGIVASLLLRTRPWPGAALLGFAMALGGVSALFWLARAESFDTEAWGYSGMMVAAYVVIILVAFGLARGVKSLVSRRSS